MIAIVGDVDTGIDYTAPNLYGQVWINQGEIPGYLRIKDVNGDLVVTFKDLNSPDNAHLVSDLNKNGYIDGGDLINDARWANDIDEDGNGKVDDIIGWNFVSNSNDPKDKNRHGTNVSSIISAAGGPTTYIVPLQVIRGRHSGRSLAECVHYFTQMSLSAKRRREPARYVAINNPNVTNVPDWHNSLAALSEAARNNILFIAAAGNVPTLNNDLYFRFPANFSSYQSAPYDNVISVTGFDRAGLLSGDYGSYTVDLAAKGPETSWSVSYVSGAVAAFAALNPNATAAKIRERLLATTEIDSAMVGKIVSGGKLDQAKFLDPSSDLRLLAAGGTFFGTDANDTIVAGPKDDLLVGHLNLPSEKYVTSEVDTLIGGGGNDLFLLGNYDNAFYANGGDADYAIVTDFEAGDRIGLHGAFSDYDLRDNTSIGQTRGLGIYRKADNELISILEGKTAAQMQSTDFETVK